MRLVRYTAIFVVPDDAELGEVKKDFQRLHERGVSANYRLLKAGANFAAARDDKQLNEYVVRYFLPNGVLKEG